MKPAIYFISLIAATSICAAQVPGCAPITHCASLAWSDTNPAGTVFNVYRATGLCSGTPAFTQIATAIPTKSYIDLTVTPGNYCFAVTASASGQESAKSPSFQALIPLFVPGQVNGQTQ